MRKPPNLLVFILLFVVSASASAIEQEIPVLPVHDDSFSITNSQTIPVLLILNDNHSILNTSIQSVRPDRPLPDNYVLFLSVYGLSFILLLVWSVLRDLKTAPVETKG